MAAGGDALSSHFLAVVLRVGGFAARHARFLLIIGLVVGVASPPAAQAMRPQVGLLIAVLLFLACLRIGPRNAIGALRDVRFNLIAALLLQVAIPLALVAVLLLTGWTGPLATALVMMAAAPPIAGAPSLVIVLGANAAPALRQLIVGTAILPFTAFVVFLAAPGFGGVGDILASAARLLAVIGFAAIAAFAIRETVLKEISGPGRNALDGLSACVMAAVVVGLMSALAPAWSRDPWNVFGVAVLAFAANLGIQVATSAIIGRRDPGLAVSMGVAAGNRNNALFLAALPAAVTEPTLLFIACYQLPMYLTPLLLGRWYRWLERRSD